MTIKTNDKNPSAINSAYLNDYFHKNIVSESATIPLNSNTPLTDQLIFSLALVKVLKNINTYLQGTKPIEAKVSKDIKKEFIKLKNKIQKAVRNQELSLIRKAHRLMAMVSRLNARELKTPEDTEKLFDDYYQVMGCLTSYMNWQEGDIIPGPHVDRSSYRVDQIITNDRGLQLVVLVPSGRNNENKEVNDPDAAPIICCRGTTADLNNVVDDMNKHIGAYSFKRSRDDILSTLQRLSKQGPIVVTGSSLGGSIGQMITAEFCDLTLPDGHSIIKSLYYFNAPGVGSETANKYKEKRDQLQPHQRPVVGRFRNRGDVVSLTGGAHLRADKKIVTGTFSLRRFFLSPIQAITRAHAWKKLISESNPAPHNKANLTHRMVRVIAEGIRRGASALFRRVIKNKVRAEKKLHAQAQCIESVLTRGT